MSTDSPPERYRRRHRWPILAFIGVMLLGTGIVWFQILKPGPVAATGCNHPGPAPSSATPTTRIAVSSVGAANSGTANSGKATSGTAASGKPTPRAAPPAKSSGRKISARSSPAPSGSAATSAHGGSKAPSSTRPPAATVTTITTTLGQFVAAATLATTRPADPSTIALQVYNASKTRGQARTLSKDLQGAGFATIKNATNDALYPAADLICQSEIRFGQAGLSQARTVLIVAPCAQLVRDDRIDETVDLALGARYTYVPVTDGMKQQLKSIHDAAAPPAVIEGQTAAPRPLASIPPLPSVDCTNSPTTSR